MIENYRIKRTDKYNVAIQRRVFGEKVDNWVTVSYHGNSPFSLISGLLELAMAQHTPSGDKLSQQLVELELEMVSMWAKLEKMIRGQNGG